MMMDPIAILLAQAYMLKWRGEWDGYAILTSAAGHLGGWPPANPSTVAQWWEAQ